MDQIAIGAGPVLAAGAMPIVLGGDHSIVLGELRAHAAAAGGPLALVLLDAHADTWDDYYGERIFHGTPFRRAVEEGLLLPERSLLAGMRGPLYSAADLGAARELGFELLTGAELQRAHARGVRAPGAREGRGRARLPLVRHRRDRPGVRAGHRARPRWPGSPPREALAFLRALAGMRFRGFDVVEVSAPYDGPGQTTAMLAANIAYEFLALSALAGS